MTAPVLVIGEALVDIVGAAARTTTRNRSGLRRTMSIAWVPIDPVEPSSTISRGVTEPFSPTGTGGPAPGPVA